MASMVGGRRGRVSAARVSEATPSRFPVGGCQEYFLLHHLGDARREGTPFQGGHEAAAPEVPELPWRLVVDVTACVWGDLMECS